MPHETIHALKCFAGGQAYCLDIDQVLAIERSSRMRPNPAPAGPNGWIVRWGKRIPVYGLAERLGAGGRTKDAEAIVVIDRANPWGMAVQRVARFERRLSRPQPVPAALSHQSGGCLSGVVIEDGSLFPCLSPERLHPDAPPLPPAQPEPPAAPLRHDGPSGWKGPGRLLLFSPRNPVRSPGQDAFLFGVSYTQILEIVSGIPHIGLPAAPRHVLGMIAWRKRPVAVVDAGALFGLDPLALRAGGRLLIARSPRWQAPVAIPIGEDFHTRALPLPHRPCRRTLSLDLTHARGVFEIDGNHVLVVPDVDAIARPSAESR